MDKRVLLRHVGTYTFDHAAQEALAREFIANQPKAVDPLPLTQLPVAAEPPAPVQGKVMATSKNDDKKPAKAKTAKAK